MSYDFRIEIDTGGSEPHYIEPYLSDRHPLLDSDGLRRNGNIMREQREWENLWTYCQSHNLNFKQTIDDVTVWLRTHHVGAILGGEV